MQQKNKEIQNEKMKRHFKRHATSLYYNWKVERGSTWKTMQLLRRIVHKKLTPIIRFTKISLLCAELGLTSWLLIGCFFNKPLSRIWISFGLNKSVLVLFSIRLIPAKPLMLDSIGSLTNKLLEWIISTNSSFENLSKWVCLTFAG